jgi:ornithine cyclodeaminase/alanine dehydrogenase-like protein (mu-crystallin family)
VAELLVLSEDDVRRLLDLDDLASALRKALKAVSSGTASVPARIGAYSPAGLVGAMPGFVPEIGLGAKLVAYFRDNHNRGLPGHQALITLFGPEDGTPRVLMGGTTITGIRTAMTAAVAAAALARPASRTLAILGAGVQGGTHLEAFTHELSFDDIRVASRDPAHAAELAGRAAVARPVDSFEEAVRGADVVCLCTDAYEPVIARAWLAPGAHVSSVGSGGEVDPETVTTASVFVESRQSATQPFPAGARELSGLRPDAVTELGEVLLGKHPGRTSDTEITLYKSTGHASEDLAAAATVYDAAVARGVGTTVTL